MQDVAVSKETHEKPSQTVWNNLTGPIINEKNSKFGSSYGKCDQCKFGCFSASIFSLKGPLQGLKQFLAIERPLKND